MRKLMSTLFFFLFILLGAQAQQNAFLKEKSKILDNQIDNLMEFQKIANKIDDDSESYWAYGQAKELLKSVDRSGKNFNRDLSKIYAAYTHIFYGMSYTKSIMTMSRGEDYSLTELNKTLIKDSDLQKTEHYNLSKQELASIYSIINFYKVSSMPKFPDMNSRYQEFSSMNEAEFKKYSALSAYKISSLNNKKLYYMTVVSLIVDLYRANNPSVSNEEFKSSMQELVNLGDKMDKIPTNHESIIASSQQEYYHWIEQASVVQKSLMGLLVNEMKKLGE